MTFPPAHGRPAIFQGRYGSRGNLELFAPSPSGGITCCWFNSDHPEGPVTEPAIPAATWSSGLVFGKDFMYDAVAAIQTTAGPDFLEVAASGPDGLHHWTWTPADGFTRTAAYDTGSGLPFIAETPDGLVLGQATGQVITRWAGGRRDELNLEAEPLALHATADGSLQALVPGTDALDLVTWARAGAVTETPTPLPLGAPAALTDGAAAVALHGELAVLVGIAVTRYPTEAGLIESLALAPSAMGTENRLEVVTRSGTTLRHHRLSS